MHQVARENSPEDDDDDAYAFHINSLCLNQGCVTLPIDVGGVSVDFIVDSGCDSNIIDREMWEECKAKKTVCTSWLSKKRLYTYTSKEPLQVAGCFQAEVSVGERKTQAEFVVIEGEGKPLLGRETSEQLGVLKIGVGVNSVKHGSDKENVGMEPDKEAMRQKVLRENRCTIRARQVERSPGGFKTDPNVKPVAQPFRRTPFGLRKALENKIQNLIEQDIIEPVEEPTEWVSPVGFEV